MLDTVSSTFESHDPPSSPLMPRTVQATVNVRAPARLHLGFLDPAGSLGRRFGSVGLMINGFETEVEITASGTDRLLADTPGAHAELVRATAYLQRLREHSDRHTPLALRLRRVLPAHAGLGSGTQLALAIGRAFAVWHALDVPTATLAQWLGRGQRSGIGIAGFDQGGLLVDGGPGANGVPAPVLTQLELPPDWRIVVVLDEGRHGLSGQQERAALATLEPLTQSAAADLCHQVLMRILPGAAQADFAAFAAGVNQLQGVLGAHFAPAQGGSAWSSPAVARLMQWLRTSAARYAAIGQSSWGPTAFVILPSLAQATDFIQAATTAGVVEHGLTLQIVSARSNGAVVTQRTAS